MKELCTHMNLIVERLRWKTFFDNKTVIEQLKEDERQLISLYVYSNTAVTKTE